MTIQSEHLPEDHPKRLEARAHLARTYLRSRRYEQAIPAWEDLVVRTRRVFGPNHVRLANALSQLGTAYSRVRREADARRSIVQARDIFLAALGPRSPGDDPHHEQTSGSGRHEWGTRPRPSRST